LEAYTMFIDISGFTSMTENLMSFGKEGAEILSRIINSVFTRCIKAVYSNGGFVSSFAGDAFTAVFQTKKAECALNSAQQIIRIFRSCGLHRTKLGEFQLNVKIGLSCGNLKYCIIDSEIQRTYFFRGEAINNCALSEHLADKMHIVADTMFIDRLEVNIEKEKIGERWYKILGVTDDIMYAKPKRKKNKIIPSGLENHFISRFVRGKKDEGEFRDIVSCFISFEEKGDFCGALKQLIANCHIFGGYFNRVDFGDKGGVSLILFGAPVSMEKLYQRAADFALSLTDIPSFRFRVGLTAGVAFAGFVGSEKRHEYTALGNIVNLSARLMMKADWGQILTEKNLTNYLRQKYYLNFNQSCSLKGFSQKVDTWILKSPITKKEHSCFSGEFIGRKAETKKLLRFISPIFDGKFGGLIYIDGSAGIGKSRFIENFKESLNNKECNFLYLNCDEILRKPFNPFSYFFKIYFEQFESNDKKQNKIAFKFKYKELINQTEDIEIKNELIRTESVIASIISLEWKNSLYSKLEAKDRYESTLYAVKNFIKALCEKSPVVTILEDCHWIDNDSMELIKVLIRNIDNYRFAIIALCRPGDDGTDFNLLNDKEVEISINRLRLAAFSEDDLTRFCSEIFKISSVPEETMYFVKNASMGNPFFAEQLILYLLENNKLDHEHRIKGGNIELPSGINQIILARIDRLSEDIKNSIKTASVLGREFLLSVLRKMLLYQKIISDESEFVEHCQIGEIQQIWGALTKISYIFKHALIRDAVYNMQLKLRLRTLHRLAGITIENLYGKNLEPHYIELSYHFGKSGDTSAERNYSLLAGKKLKDQGLYPKALRLLRRALELIPAKNIQEKRNLEHIIATALEGLGDYKGAQSMIDPVISYLRQKGSKEKLINPLCTLGLIKERLGHYGEAKQIYVECLEIVQDSHSGEIDKANILSHLGAVLITMGEYDSAMEKLKECLQVIKQSKSALYEALVLSLIGIIHAMKNEVDEAIELLEKSLSMFRSIGFPRLQATNLVNLGAIYQDKQELSRAYAYTNEAMKIYHEIGDQYGESACLANLSSISRLQNNLTEAGELILQSIRISRKIGSIPCLMSCLLEKARQFAKKKDWERALYSWGLVISNPKSWAITRSDAQDDINNLHGEVPGKLVEEILKSSKSTNLDLFLDQLFE